MSIKHIPRKIKGIYEALDIAKIQVILLILLVGLASFGLGRLSMDGVNKEEVRIYHNPLEANVSGFKSTEDASGIPQSGEVVASKNSDKYHFPWCSGAKRISEENKVWYDSIKDAQAAGLTAAANCKGLE